MGIKRPIHPESFVYDPQEHLLSGPSYYYTGEETAGIILWLPAASDFTVNGSKVSFPRFYFITRATLLLPPLQQQQQPSTSNNDLWLVG